MTVPYILAGSTACVLTSLAAGLSAIRALRVELNRAESLCLGYCLGSAIVSTLTLALAFLSLARKGVFVAVTLVALVFLWRLLPWFRALQPTPIGSIPVFYRAVFVAWLVYGSLYFRYALAPERSPDGISYHLGLVNLWNHAHGHLNNGTWQNTWPALQSNPRQLVSLYITAGDSQQLLTGMAEVDGGLSSPQTPPSITQAGIVSAASPSAFTPLAPGSIITIYGNLLADDNAVAQTLPLPTVLGNTQVLISGQPVPLFYASQGQINAVVPFGLNTNTTLQLVVQRDQSYSSPVPINVADAQPGAFSSNGSAIVFDARGTAPQFPVSSSSPAQAGDVLVFYCGGLGLTTQPVGDGDASPSAPTMAPVTVTIGGQNANVLYAGLVEGLVGLYQVNVTMPSGVAPGQMVPVTFTVAGQISPAAYISTQ